MTSSLVPIGTFCYGSLSAIFVFWAFLVGPTTLFSHLHCCMYWSIERDRFRYFVRGGFIHSFTNWTLVTRTRSSSVDFLFIYFPVFPSASKSAVALRWRGCLYRLAGIVLSPSIAQNIFWWWPSFICTKWCDHTNAFCSLPFFDLASVKNRYWQYDLTAL